VSQYAGPGRTVGTFGLGRTSARMMLVVGDGSNEKRFRQLYRTALETEVTPALTALGFDAMGEGGRGGHRVQWNKDFDLATNIGESKWNKFGDVFSHVFDLDDRKRGPMGPRDLVTDTSSMEI
jgi:hypothetical protein